jgi:hypothetical protein
MAYENDFKVPDGKAYCFTVKERKSEYSPHFKGQMVLTKDYKAGDVIKLAVWSQTTKNGLPWIKIAEENWVPSGTYVNKQQYPKEVSNINEDEIPF